MTRTNKIMKRSWVSAGLAAAACALATPAHAQVWKTLDYDNIRHFVPITEFTTHDLQSTPECRSTVGETINVTDYRGLFDDLGGTSPDAEKSPYETQAAYDARLASFTPQEHIVTSSLRPDYNPEMRRFEIGAWQLGVNPINSARYWRVPSDQYILLYEGQVYEDSKTYGFESLIGGQWTRTKYSRGFEAAAIDLMGSNDPFATAKDGGPWKYGEPMQEHDLMKSYKIPIRYVPEGMSPTAKKWALRTTHELKSGKEVNHYKKTRGKEMSLPKYATFFSDEKRFNYFRWYLPMSPEEAQANENQLRVAHEITVMRPPLRLIYPPVKPGEEFRGSARHYITEFPAKLNCTVIIDRNDKVLKLIPPNPNPRWKGPRRKK